MCGIELQQWMKDMSDELKHEAVNLGFWTPERTKLLAAFAIAPAIPILILALWSFPVGIVVVLIGLPIAYICALILGLPVLLLLKKTRLMGWPYFVLGGVLCTIPAFALFYNVHSHYIFQIDSMISFALIGSTGALMFWWIGVMNNVPLRQNNRPDLPGLVMLVGLIALFAYLLVLSKIEYVEGTLVVNQQVYLDDEDQQVEITLPDGQLIEARLPAGMPVLKGCAVKLAKWQDLFTWEHTYSVTLYPQAPMAHMNFGPVENVIDQIDHHCRE